MNNLEKLLEGVAVEWKTLGDVITLEKGKQLNKELLSETGLYPAYNGGISFSGFTDIFNYYENTTIISQGGASAGFEIRKELTDEWKRCGLEEGVQFATLTDIIYKTWSDHTAKEYKRLKNLKNGVKDKCTSCRY